MLNYFDELEVHPEHFGRVGGGSVVPFGGGGGRESVLLLGTVVCGMSSHQVSLFFLKMSLVTLAKLWRTL